MPLKSKYTTQLDSELKSTLNKTNAHALPHLEKIVLNIGFGRVRDKKEVVDKIKNNLATISGQIPKTTKAKKSIAGFKVREGELVGMKVTLRGERMYSFFDKIINIVLPQIRDFNGMKKSSFDGDGNYTFGIKEQVIFPEISYDDIDVLHGLSVTITINSKTEDEARKYLELIGFPFERNE